MKTPVDWSAVRKALQPYMVLEREFRKRFTDARSRLATLKKQTLAGVTRWEWYTDFHHELDPMFFVLGCDVKPGRMLKREPMSKLGSMRYGFDAQGRVVADEKYLTSEEFREYKTGRIDTARFHASKKCIDVQTLFLDKNQPKAHASVSSKGLLIRLYESQNGKIIGVLEAVLDNPATRTKTEWQFRHYSVTEKRPGTFLIHCAHENGYVEKSGYVSPELPKKQIAPPVIDLRKEAKEVVGDLADLFATFSKLQKVKGKKAVPPISAIHLSFHHYTHWAPSLTLGFDTRPEHLEDGNWTHSPWKMIEKPKWKDFSAECECAGGRGFVIDMRGKQNTVRIGHNVDRPVTWFGEMTVVALLLVLKKHPLQLRPKCSIEVTDYLRFNWKRLAIAGKKDLVRAR